MLESNDNIQSRPLLALFSKKKIIVYDVRYLCSF